MKELFESAFDIGKQSVDYTSVDFYEWWELNKSKIDNAIKSYLESQGKVIVKVTKITRDLGRYELQDDPQEIDYDFDDYKPGQIVMEENNSD